MFDLLRADLAHHYLLDTGDRHPPLRRRIRVVLDSPALQGTFVFRFGAVVQTARLPWVVRKPLGLLYFVLDKITIAMWNVHIDPRARIGGGLYVGHTGGILIGPASMGPDCCVAHNVTIGLRADGRSRGLPTIGARVWVGSGSILFGGITIGDGVSITPLSVVGRNIAPGTLVGGNPMQVLSHNYDNTVQIFGERAEAPESH